MSDGPGEKPKDPDGGVHRLLDMLVEEVSLVDRAANKRRFLVVKRESEDMGKKKTEETPAGSSGSPAAPSAPAAPKPPKKKPAKKVPARPPTTTKAKAPPPKKGPERDPDEEEEEEQEEEDESISKARPPKKNPDEDADEEEEEEQEEEDEETAKAKPPKKNPDEDADDDEDESQEDEPEDAPASEDEPTGRKPPKRKATKDEAGGESGPGAPDDEAADEDEETPLSVALAALDSLTQAVEILSDSPEDGTQLAKIAGDIRAAADAISSAAGIEADADENQEPAQATSIEGLVSSIQEMLTKIDSLTQALSASAKTPAATPTITAETQAPPDLAGTLAEVAQSMKSLNEAMKKQAARLDALEKRAGISNSQPPGERVIKSEEDDATSWPLDMNKPRDRASTQKAVSFHD